MLIKSKIIISIIIFLISSITISNSIAEEFNISAAEVTVDKKNNLIMGKGNVVATDEDGKRDTLTRKT